MYIIVAETEADVKLLFVAEATDLMQTVTAMSLIPMEVDKVLSCTQPNNSDATDTTPPGQFYLMPFMSVLCSSRLLTILKKFSVCVCVYMIVGPTRYNGVYLIAASASLTVL